MNLVFSIAVGRQGCLPVLAVYVASVPIDVISTLNNLQTVQSETQNELSRLEIITQTKRLWLRHQRRTEHHFSRLSTSPDFGTQSQLQFSISGLQIQLNLPLHNKIISPADTIKGFSYTKRICDFFFINLFINEENSDLVSGR